MYIAASITGQTLDQALKNIEAAVSQQPDILELRIDYMKDLSEKALDRLLAACELPVIVTNRHRDESGPDPKAGFKGLEIRRIAYLKQAIDRRAAYVDVEARHYHPFEKQTTKLIVSYHDFDKTPENLTSRYKMIKSLSNADIAKFATKAVSEEDVRRMIELIEQADTPIIGICMGELGERTRLHPGNYLTFACLTKEQASAPGQFTVEQIREKLS